VTPEGVEVPRCVADPVGCRAEIDALQPQHRPTLPTGPGGGVGGDGGGGGERGRQEGGIRMPFIKQGTVPGWIRACMTGLYLASARCVW